MDQSLFRYIWRKSRPEQIVILTLILLSMPTYFLSLDVPKRIVNDALQGRAFTGGRATANLFSFDIALPQALGGAHIASFPGLELGQLSYLMALSFTFLVLVLINGAFKLVINIRKGVLGERVLKQMRYDVFAVMMRFRPEDIRTLKPAEAASMIKDEIEPIGEFAGDAYIQPAFLGVQAVTALVFIVLQNIWLGLVALVVVLTQALLIPRLRQRLLVLGRARQLGSRKLAGRIGSVVETAPVVHVFGAAEYQKSIIERQLQYLLGIRISLYKRKFAVKYLNNLLAQIAPFFFYAIGGYFALRGQLDIGQLVAAIIAYRDLPPPVKELIDWDQQRNDVTIKYEQVIHQLSEKVLMPVDAAGGVGEVHGLLQTSGLEVSEAHGRKLLSAISIEIPYPSHVALVGSTDSGRDAFAKAISRQISNAKGEVLVGGRRLGDMSVREASRHVIYAGVDAGLMAGSIRENVLLAVRKSELGEHVHADEADVAWIDLGASGAARLEEINARIVEALDLVGMRDDLYRFGLHGCIAADSDGSIASRLVLARQRVQAELERQGMLSRVELFDPDRYNRNSTIGENILFGVPVDRAWTEAEIGRNRLFLRALAQEKLSEDLVEIGRKVAITTLEMMSDLPAGHPIFERYSLIGPHEIDETRKQLEEMQSERGLRRRKRGTGGRFISIALRYNEERHRFGLVGAELMERVVRLRHRLRGVIDKWSPGAVAFFDPNSHNVAAPIRDNLLFGRTGFGLPQTEQRILDIIHASLNELRLDPLIREIGLDYDVGPGGKLLSPTQRAAVNVARCLVRKSPIVVIDGALVAFAPEEQAALLERLAGRMRDRTLIVTLPEGGATDGFDKVLLFSSGTVKVAAQLARAV